MKAPNAVANSTHRARITFEQLGGPLTLLYGIHRFLQRLSGGRSGLICYGLYAQPVGAGQYAAVPDDAATIVERVGPEAPVVLAFPRPREVIAHRFLRHAQCYAATVKGRFAGHIWLACSSHDEDEVRCRYQLPDNCSTVWDFDVYVDPSLRMGRTLARLWKAVDSALAQDGVRWSFSRISLFNRQSVATHERLGAIRVGFATFLRLGSVQIALLNNAPFVHVCIGAGAGPNVRIRLPRGSER